MLQISRCKIFVAIGNKQFRPERKEAVDRHIVVTFCHLWLLIVTCCHLLLLLIVTCCHMLFTSCHLLSLVVSIHCVPPTSGVVQAARCVRADGVLPPWGCSCAWRRNLYIQNRRSTDRVCVFFGGNCRP